MTRTLILAAAAALLLAPAIHAQVIFDTGPGATGNAYDLVTAGSIPWADARTGAMALSFGACGNGRLATIESQEENDFLEALLPAGFVEAWIGLYEEDPIGQPEVYSWITGEPLSFVNWAAGEPNGDGNEAGMWGPAGGQPGAWNDEGSLGLIDGYLVEFECPAAAPTTGPAGLALLALLLLAGALWALRRRPRPA